MAEFQDVWKQLQKHLRSGMVIRNWTVLKDYFGEDFKITLVDQDAIQVDAPGANNIQIVPKGDFEAVWEIWTEYLYNDFSRQEMRDMTRFSKYIISILHWYDQEVSHG